MTTEADKTVAELMALVDDLRDAVAFDYAFHAPNEVGAARYKLEQAIRRAVEWEDWTKDAREYGNALNDAAWVFIETCPEKSTRLFNHCKPALRAAILKYAESLAAAPSPGSGT